MKYNKKTFRRSISTFLITCLIMSLCCSVGATGIDNRSQELPDPDLGGGSSTTLYTLNANGLTGLTHTSQFTKDHLPNNATKLVASGNLTHSAASGLTAPTIRAGFGFMQAGTNTVIPNYYKDFSETSAYVYEQVSVSSLTNNARYVGLIKNLSPSYGTVSGQITIYTIN